MTPKKQEAKQPEVKQPEVKTEVKPQPTPTPAAPAPAPTPIGKQQQTLDKLIEAWKARGVNVEKMTATPDGKFLNVIVGDGWPLIVIGASGGINLPTIKSYPSAYTAAVDGDKLLAKQVAREQKKAAASVPAPAKPEAGKPEEKKAEVKPPSTIAKKKQQDQKLEAQLA